MTYFASKHEKEKGQDAHLFRFWGMASKLHMIRVDGDDLGVKTLLERCKGSSRVSRVPYRRRSHAEYLGTLIRGHLEVFAHDAIIRVVLPCMVALVEYYQGDLSCGVCDGKTRVRGGGARQDAPC